MDDTSFHSLSSATLSRIYDALEGAFESGALEDLEMETGLLTIVTGAGQSFIVSAHAPSKQIWLASPISGGLHFSQMSGQWKLANSDTLEAVLSRELGVAL